MTLLCRNGWPEVSRNCGDRCRGFMEGDGYPRASVLGIIMYAKCKCHGGGLTSRLRSSWRCFVSLGTFLGAARDNVDQFTVHFDDLPIKREFGVPSIVSHEVIIFRLIARLCYSVPLLRKFQSTAQELFKIGTYGRWECTVFRGLLPNPL